MTREFNDSFSMMCKLSSGQAKASPKRDEISKSEKETQVHAKG
jgi:hypothetical protein